LFGADNHGLLRPAVDIEDTTRDWSAWVRDFIRIARQLNRRDPRMLIYTSGSFPDSHYRGGWNRWDTDIALWIAHHTGTPGQTPYLFDGRTALHQYTDTARVPGIEAAPGTGVSGAVDLNSTVGSWSLTDLMND